MKIMFIKPKTDLHIIFPPINFLYLAGHLTNHEIKIIDAHNYNLSDKQIFKEIELFKPDVIGFGGLSSEIDFSLALAQKIRKNFNGKIIFGGPHVTNTKEILEKDYIDFTFSAESEIPFAEFINKLEKNEDYSNVSNLGYKKGNKIFFNPIKLYDYNLIKIPKWDLINLRDYPKLFINKGSPSAPIFTTRGCPYNCTFCSSSTIAGNKYRERDLDKVIGEIKLLKEKFGIKEFHIFDENFTLNKERAIKFCDKLIKENLNLLWNCPNGIRIDTLDNRLLKKMKEAGCWAVSLPIEFGTQRMLDVINKKTNLNKMLEILPLVEENGIQATCFFILGHPEEKEEEIKKTIALSKKLPISRAYFSIYKLLPGSSDYKKYGEDKKRIIFSEGDKKLKNFQRYALLSFYLRPKILIRFIKDNASIPQITELFKIFKTFILK